MSAEELQRANQTFQEVFGLYEEQLIQAYSCSMWYRKVYCPGTLYISQNYLCFQSKVLDQQPIVPLNQAMELRKERSAFTSCIYIKMMPEQSSAGGVGGAGSAGGAAVGKGAAAGNGGGGSGGEGREYWFAMFVGWGKGEEAYVVAQELWKQHLNRAHQQLDLQLHTTRKSKYLDSEFQSFQIGEQPVPGLPAAVVAAGVSSGSSAAVSLTSSEQHEVNGGTTAANTVFGLRGFTGVAQRLLHVQKNHDFLSAFKLPRSEQLVEGYPVPCAYQRRDVSLPGSLFLSRNFICFRTDVPPTDTFLRFVVPLVEVTDMQRQTNPLMSLFSNSSFKVTATAHCTPREFLFSLSQRDKHFNDAWQVWTWCIKRRGQDVIAAQAQTCPHATATPPVTAGGGDGSDVCSAADGGCGQTEEECAVECRSRKPSTGTDFRTSRLALNAQPRKTTESIWRELLHNTKFFDPEYCKKQQKQEQIWQRYLALNGSGVTMHRTQDFALICIRGIPDSLRGMMWMYSSGALFRSAIKPGYYQSLLDEHAGQESQAIMEIEKDLERSFPEHPYYHTKEGIDTLRNVLVAYSWRNPAIGYCQSMNILAALLLLYTDEEDCFWLLSVIVEDICPKYYSRAMVGSKIDQGIVDQLMEKHLPQVHAHLKKVAFPTSILTQPWLLCLFIGFLPMQQVLRILDCLFCQGPSILFKVGLAMFKVVEKEILSYDRMEEIFVLWKERKWSGHEVLQVAILDYGDIISNRTVAEMRALAQYEAMQLVESNSKRTLLRGLSEKTLFSDEELESLYHKCRSIFPADSESNTLMDHTLFAKLFNMYAPFWRGKETFMRYVFHAWDKNCDGLVDMVDIAPGLSVALKGDFDVRLKFCLEITDLDHDGNVTEEQLRVAIDAFTSIFMTQQSGKGVVFQREDQEAQLERFVKQCFSSSCGAETVIVGRQPCLPGVGDGSEAETAEAAEDAITPALPLNHLLQHLLQDDLLLQYFSLTLE